MCTLFKTCLHCPVADKITTISKKFKAKDIHCSDGIIFLSGPIKAVEFKVAQIYFRDIQEEEEEEEELERRFYQAAWLVSFVYHT